MQRLLVLFPFKPSIPIHTHNQPSIPSGMSPCNPPLPHKGSCNPLLPQLGLTKILRALTFAGHLSHPHQCLEVALCSKCDTWKHGSIGRQIRGGVEILDINVVITPASLPYSYSPSQLGKGLKATIGYNGKELMLLHATMERDNAATGDNGKD